MIKYYLSSSPDFSIDIKEPFCIPFNSEIETINLEKIKQLLLNDKIKVDNIDSIKIKDQKRNVYIEFNDDYQINEEEDIVLLLHFLENDDEEYLKLETEINTIKKLIEKENNIKKIDKTKDLIYLYASPIVSRIENTDNVYNEYELQLDYRGEIKEIVSSIKPKKIDASFDCCDYDTLLKSIRLKPKILHISCHGSKKGKEFYLFLEDKGVKWPIKLEDICKVIEQEKNLNEIEVIFISACQSKPLGEKFLEYGVKNVICIASETPITDIAAQKFSKEFYYELFNGESVKNAFEKTKNSFNDIKFNKELNDCCCNHEHKNDCKFRKSDHNKYHIKKCKCTYNEYHIHKYDCDFLKYLKTKNFCSKKLYNNTEKICCCSPEIPHNESNKFILLSKDEDHVIDFQDNINFTLNLNCPINYYKEKKNQIFGRGREIKKVYDMFENDIYFILVVGKRFVGKKFFAESTAIYLLERKIIKNFEKVQINSSLSVNYLRKKIESLDKDSQMLFIIHFSLAIKNEIETLKAVLTVLKELKNSLKIYKYLILIDHDNIDYSFIENDFKLKDYDSIKIDILRDESGLKYLDNLNYNINLSKNDLSNLIKETGYYPCEINNLSHIIQNETYFKNILDKYIEEKKKNKKNIDELEEFLKNKDTKELLFLLASLPKGLYNCELFLLKVKIDKIKEINNFIKKEELNENIYKIDEKYIYKILLNIENDEHLINIYLIKIIKMYSIIFFKYLNDEIRKENLKKENSNYEFNALNNLGIWKTFNEKNYKKCFDNNNFDISLIKDLENYTKNSRFNIELLIENNKKNFKILLNEDEYFLEYFEQLLLYLPTIFKYNNKKDECIELLNQYIKLCEELNLNNSKERLKLFLYSIEFHPNFQPESFSHSILKEGRAEAFLLKGYSQIKTDGNSKEIIDNLKEALEIFKSDEKFKIKKCFVEKILGNYYYKLYLKNKCKKDWENMENYYISAIKNNDDIIYKIKFSIEFGKIYYKKHKYEKAQYYLTLANDLAKNINIEYFIQNTKNILDDIITKNEYNITILSANPLIDEKNSEIFANNNSQITFLKKLDSKIKNLKIKFNVLNQKNLEDCFSFNGETLIIKSDCFSEEGLIMEEENGKNKLIEIKELIDLQKKQKNKYKLIILAFINSVYMLNLFRLFNVDYIITFEVINEYLDPDQILDINTKIDIFILKFLENCANNTMEKSFFSAKSYIEKKLKSKNFKTIVNITKKNNNLDDEKLFCLSHESTNNHKNHYNRKFKPFNLSNDVPNSLKKGEIFELINLINKKKLVNLYGLNKKTKIDKKEINIKLLIAKEIADFYLRHNQFKDGIYYTDIKKNNYYKLTDILKDLQIQNYSSDMSIFIIINDFNEKLIGKISDFLNPNLNSLYKNLNLLYISNSPINKKIFESFSIGIQNSKTFTELSSIKKNKIPVKSYESDNNFNYNNKIDINSSSNSIENENNNSIDYDKLIIEDDSVNNNFFDDDDNNNNNNNININNNNNNNINNNNIIINNNNNENEDDNNSSNQFYDNDSYDDNYFNNDND